MDYGTFITIYYLGQLVDGHIGLLTTRVAWLPGGC